MLSADRRDGRYLFDFDWLIRNHGSILNRRGWRNVGLHRNRCRFSGGRRSRRRHRYQIRDLRRRAIIEFENENALEQQHSDASQNGQKRDQLESFVISFFFHAAQSRLLNFNFQLQTVSGILCPCFKSRMTKHE